MLWQEISRSVQPVDTMSFTHCGLTFGHYWSVSCPFIGRGCVSSNISCYFAEGLTEHNLQFKIFKLALEDLKNVIYFK